MEPTDFNDPIPKGGGKDLELLPEREWLHARIADVKYEYAVYNNEIQVVKDSEGNIILGDDGEPIKRKQFEITFHFKNYSLPDGSPRRAWLRLGASMSIRSHLFTFLYNLNCHEADLTPAGLIDHLKGTDVKLQLSNKLSKDGSKTYQNVIFDAVKLAEETIPKVEEEPWEE